MRHAQPLSKRYAGMALTLPAEVILRHMEQIEFIALHSRDEGIRQSYLDLCYAVEAALVSMFREMDQAKAAVHRDEA